MARNIHIAIIPQRCSPSTWDDIYQKACRVAQQWSPRPLAPGRRQIGAHGFSQYTLEVEAADGLRITGDAESRAVGECFWFPAQLDHISFANEDILSMVVQHRDPTLLTLPRWHKLFGADTRRCPYRVLVIALGLLVEHSLPEVAVVYGDISAKDGVLARHRLESILREPIKLPVVVNEHRLARRFRRVMWPEMVDRSVEELTPPDPDLLAALNAFTAPRRDLEGEQTSYELEQVIYSCPDPSQLSQKTQDLLRRLITAIRAGIIEHKFRQVISDLGRTWACEQMAQQIAFHDILLTTMAWDRIEATDLDELVTLFGATRIIATKRGSRLAIRGLLENPALWRL